MNTALAAVLGLVLGGCAITPEEPAIEIHGLVFANLTPVTLLRARLQVIQDHRFVSCSHILPGSECLTTFPPRRYTGAPVEVTWQLSPERSKRQVLRVEPPADHDGSAALLAFIRLSEDEASAVLQPCQLPGICPTAPTMPEATGPAWMGLPSR